MMSLELEIRTPTGVLVRQRVRAITAEDHTGWFGIRPGRTDVVAVLPPGLLVFRDDDGEGFVALSGGVLSLQRGRCQVLALEAAMGRDLDAIAEEAARQARRRRDRSSVHRGAIRDLAREAVQLLLRESS